MGVREVALVYSRLVGGKGWEGVVGRRDWWVLDRQNEEPMWRGGGNVVPVRGKHEGKGAVLVGYHIYS